MLKACGKMKSNRSWLCSADDRNHCAKTDDLRSVDKRIQQSAADPTSNMVSIDVDAIFTCKGISGTITKLRGIRIPNNLIVNCGDNERPSLSQYAVDLHRHFLWRRRRHFIGCRSVQNMVAVDSSYRFRIIQFSGTHPDAHLRVASTTSPSSLTKVSSCAFGSSSSTASDGRHSFTPSGETTSGRLMRIGCCIMASIKASSLNDGSSRPSSA